MDLDVILIVIIRKVRSERRVTDSFNGILLYNNYLFYIKIILQKTITAKGTCLYLWYTNAHREKDQRRKQLSFK